jgi:hypothetical protein
MLPMNHIQSNLRDLSSLANNAKASNSLDLGVRVTPFIHLQHIMSWFESNICSTIYLPKTFLSVDKNLLFLSGLVLRSIFSLRA